KVNFRMLVTETDGWIDQVAVTESADPAKSAIKPTTRLVRDVDILKIGDKIPNYPFTNELGRAFTLKEFEGKALAITFIFTRCPFPTFCPLMNENFKKTYTSLKANAQAPANWHLLSLSFDPEFDTPATMKQYAQRYSYDTNHWSFATGALVEIDAITEQFGMVFSRQPGAFNFDHNLRTVVLDTRGRVHQIFIGNSWTPAELAEQLTQAAKVPAEAK
ncbi:MAG TPA: SCO family protein, partial [Roseimicrobium sp.]|nr:SCO family protein [Roseimicrobium sp.]